MIYRDNQLFESKLAEICKLSRSSDYICIDERDAEIMSRDIKEKTLVEITTLKASDLLKELSLELDALHLDNPVDILIRISSSGLTMNDLSELDSLIHNSHLQIECCKRALSSDKTMNNSNHSLQMFIFVKNIPQTVTR